MFSCIFLQLRKPNSAHKDRLCTISSGMWWQSPECMTELHYTTT
jgi:hypothetical protein